MEYQRHRDPSMMKAGFSQVRMWSSEIADAMSDVRAPYGAQYYSFAQPELAHSSQWVTMVPSSLDVPRLLSNRSSVVTQRGSMKPVPHKASISVSKHKMPKTVKFVSISDAANSLQALARPSPSPELKESEAAAARKRSTRKCRFGNCTNSVVQGGLCIAHGAKRKQCKHPGCTKNVKKAGLCSAHGPARKRCETEGCPNIAVQGGLCISHGARKRLCEHEGCTKKSRAVYNHLCKKHYDEELLERTKPVPSPEAVSQTSSPSAGSPFSPLSRQCFPVRG
mmetsp:Transcript_21130/g.61112  ORF Transcript_21130/g.61112 Transcript_21130/m.61112 type:complete len:280 (-) Transcript_21130:70-909(-)